jgi:RNA recognition motif-containing protein
MAVDSMAAIAEIDSNEAPAAADNNNKTITKNSDSDSNPKSESDYDMKNLVDIFTKLNPSAKEFFPSNYTKIYQQHDHHQLKNNNNQLSAAAKSFVATNKISDNDNLLNNRRGRRRLNGRAFRAQREDSVRRTVYVSDIDQNITEERLAALFSSCGQVQDCRVCGDPHSVLRFAFVEFADEHGARAALSLGGTMMGYYPVRVLPSKTAILPVNPTFLPRSEDEREMCIRTVYCTNIDKKVSQAEVKSFFELACGGEVTRLRILGDNVHSTRIAFVEFALAEKAITALSCSGLLLGTQPIRVSPSKTPVRPRVTRPENQ